MRFPRTKALAAALALSLTAGIGIAGDSDCPSCPNACPLAKSANELRTNGSEGVAASKAVQKDVRREVLASLDRV